MSVNEGKMNMQLKGSAVLFLYSLMFMGMALFSGSHSVIAQSTDWEHYKAIKLKTADEPVEESRAEKPVVTSADRKANIKIQNTVSKERPENTVSNVAHPQLGLVYTRVPRTHGQHTVTLKDGSDYVLESPDIWDTLPDVRRKFSGFNAPGQLVYLMPDGTERILYDCFTKSQPCVPLDPMVSFDGGRILFSVYRAPKFGRARWDGLSLPNKTLAGNGDAQLHIVDLATGRIEVLAHIAGVHDVSPVWLPDGRIMFSSDRDRNLRPSLHRIPTPNVAEPQLFIADAHGNKARNISPHEVTAANHPYVLSSGRVAYSSHWMSHNLAYIGNNGSINWPTTVDNMWMLADIDREGGDMTALLGAHRSNIKDAGGRTKTMKALHFLGQRENNDICVVNYYRANNLGLGDVFCFPPEPKGVEGALPNFIPHYIYSVANWSKSNDEPSWKIDGIYQGKIGYPEGIANNQLMLTVGRGYCTQVSGTVTSFQKAVADQPGKLGCDTGIYQTTQIPSRSMTDIIKVVDKPEWHEFGARIVRARKVETPALVKSGDKRCLIASSDAGVAETAPHRPYVFNKNYRTSANHGGEIDGLAHSEVVGIRFWELVPNKGKLDFKNSIGNKLKLLGDAPLLADKSFVAELPCDTPYIMAGIDSQGRAIKRDQIPQSLRAGEKRICSGCHLHSKPGRPYRQSLAFTAAPAKLTKSSAVPTFERDIKPMLQHRCAGCHIEDVPISDYDKLVWDYFQEFVPEDRKQKLMDHKNPRRVYGLQRPYTSKYVNNMYARESLLYWKAANERSDGRTDQTYKNDIDFGVNHPTQITASELRLLAEWLDSGAGR